MEDIRVEIITHEKTGLLVATSPDLRGLYAHGRTIDDLEVAVTRAIKDILEANLQTPVTVRKRPEDRKRGFAPSFMKFATDKAIAA